MLTDYYYPHVGGGVEKAVTEISRALLRRGTKVGVFTLDTEGHSSHEIVDGVEVFRSRARDLTPILGLQSSASLRALTDLLGAVDGFNPDVLHANNLFFTTSALSVLAKKLHRLPLVVTMHLGSIDDVGGLTGSLAATYERTIARRILENSNHVIAVSRAVSDHASALGVPRSKLSVVPNGVDTDVFRPDPSRKKGSKKRILSVGRLVPNKGIQVLVRAAPAVLAEHDVEFLVIGRGPMLAELESLARKEGVREAFSFLGLVPSVSDMLQTCDVFVRPSMTEGMPLTVLEAMACGVPVVATSVAGTSEIVHQGSTGLLCPPGDAHSLAQAINASLDDPQLAKRLGENGRAMVGKGYDWEGAARMTRDVYESLGGAG